MNFDPTSSHLLDPRWEERTDEERSSWEAYVAAIKAAATDYEHKENTARAEYIKNRRGHIVGIFGPIRLRNLLTPWPPVGTIEKFDGQEAAILREYENSVFIAAREYTKVERDARLVYWNSRSLRASAGQE